jgi:hypothetical protein
MRFRPTSMLVLAALGLPGVVAADAPPRPASSAREAPAGSSGPAQPLVGSPSPDAVVLERIVAVVDHQIILLSEVQKRSAPHLVRIAEAIPQPGPARAAAEARVAREMLDRMIDEALQAAEGARLRVEVTDAELDRALSTVASSQGLTVPDLIKAAASMKMDERAYREELRRQVLEGKLLNRRAAMEPRAGASLSSTTSPQALEQLRGRWRAELRAGTYVEDRL